MSDAPQSPHPHDPPAARRQHRRLPHRPQHHRLAMGLPWLCLLLLVMSTLCSAVSVTSGTSGHNRRRSGGASLTGSAGGSGLGLTSLEDTGDKSVPDQLALAASRRGSEERSYPRRGSVIHSRTKEVPSKDYNYGHVELNLVRPEQETHPKLLLSTTTAASGPGSSGASVHLEDSQSAAEYVANAIKLAYNQPPVQFQLKTTSQVPATSSSSTQRSYIGQREREREQQLELQLQKELQAQQQQQQQQLQQQQQQQQQQLQQQQQQQQQQHLQQQQQPQQHQQHLQQPHQPHQQHLLLSSSATASSLGSSSLNASPALAPAPVYEKEPVTRSYDIYEGSSSASIEPEPHNRGLIPVQEEIERHYRPKYHSSSSGTTYNYGQYPYRNLEAEAEEKVRVSASTEIPKSEIMKQIEKSVIKYMKELEAEGKILSTPQEPVTPPPPPLPQASVITKSYYKTQTGSSTSSALEDKRYSSSTMRPKYTVAPVTQQQTKQQIHQVYHQQQHHQHPVQQQQQQPQQITLGKVRSSSQKPLPQQQHFQSETETAYQAPDLPVDELSPNVEFIYKIKTRAPLQTATVKTVSKPYTLPLKSAEHFDHGAALKNIEEFDLSHVVPTPERVERERDSSREDLERGKTPHKLYFNSEIYHDINSLPYKSKEAAAAAALHEYQRHKLKAGSSTSISGEIPHPDYKGYGGYFAEPEPTELDNEEGYHQHQHHHHQPYHHYHVVKKEPLEEHEHEHDHDSWVDTSGLRLANAHAHAQAHGHGHQHSLNLNNHGHGHSQHSHIHGQHPVKHQSLDYDSYSPKFNNNPEGYGYQHTYKGASRGLGQGQGQGLGVASQGAGGSAGKRGKRGNGAHPRQEAIKKQLRASEVKDLEASLALRPPPK